jgi:hypothetical protein
MAAPAQSSNLPPMSGDVVRQLEEGAKNLNLTVEAFVLFLLRRQAAGSDAARFERHVEQVFGKHGDLMRRLAK